MAHLPNVPVYDDLLDNRRKSISIEGFDFDTDTFENLLSAFTPKESVPVILNVSTKRLDDFCRQAYGMNYAETYMRLSGIADFWMRKAIGNLAVSGNGTALSIAAKHFMNLRDDEEKKAIQVTIVNDLDK